jgi:hypothetical protein
MWINLGARNLKIAEFWLTPSLRREGSGACTMPVPGDADFAHPTMAEGLSSLFSSVPPRAAQAKSKVA